VSLIGLDKETGENFSKESFKTKEDAGLNDSLFLTSGSQIPFCYLFPIINKRYQAKNLL